MCLNEKLAENMVQYHNGFGGIFIDVSIINSLCHTIMCNSASAFSKTGQIIQCTCGFFENKYLLQGLDAGQRIFYL